MHVWLVWKHLLLLNRCFCRKVIELWRSAIGHLLYRKEFGQNLVFLVHIFLFFYLKCSKTGSNDSLMIFNEIRWFYWKKCKNLKIFDENGQILGIFYKNLIFSKSRRYGFCLQKWSEEVEIWSSSTSIWYLKICGTDFWIFDFFGTKIVSKILDILPNLSTILDIFPKKAKFQKSVPTFFRYHIEVPQDQISAS